MSAASRRLNTGREVFAAILGGVASRSIGRGLKRARHAGLNLAGYFWMIDRNLARGVFLAAVALTFGVYSLRYPVGSWDRAGPGLFPLMVSGALLAMALMMVVRSRFQKPEPFEFNVKNIGLLLVSLCVFALLSLYVNMVVAIVAMVFIAGKAAATYSVSRNVKISLGLIVVAFAFQKLLGLSLPLL